MIFKGFFEHLNKSPNSTAFMFYRKKNIIQKTYLDFFTDTNQAVTHLIKSGVKAGDNVLILIKPSYNFYVALSACFCLKCRAVIIDSYKDSNRVKDKLLMADVNLILCDKKTRIFLKFLRPLRKRAAVLLNGYEQCKPIEKKHNFKSEDQLLVTFTSGGTGKSKMVIRTFGELMQQMDTLTQNFGIFSPFAHVVMMLPIYPLAGLASGLTNILYFENMKRARYVCRLYRLIKSTDADSVVGSVSKYLLLKQPINNMKQVFTGGSIIFPNDAQHIKAIFPNAEINYIYGSSEAVIISRTTLDNYLEELRQNKFGIGKPANGAVVKIHSETGEILLSGDYVLNSNNGDRNVCIIDGQTFIRSGDLGYLEDNKLYIRGRIGLSDIESTSPVFNYEIELEIINRYKLRSRPYFTRVNKSNILVLEREKKEVIKQIAADYPQFDVIKIKKVPLDERHNYKADYTKLIGMLNEKLRK